MMATGEAGLHRSVTLSALEFDVLSEHLGLDSMPLVFKVASPGRTHTERAELASGVWDSLSIRGLGSPSALDPNLESMLRLLAKPQREVDGRMWFGRSLRVLAASNENDEAVLAVKDGDTFTVRWAAVTGLPREASSVLPSVPAGPGRSVTLRSADLDAAASESGDDLQALGAALRRRGIRQDDTEVLIRMIGEAEARGQFGAASRDRWNRRIRTGHVVGFFDSPHGRYVQLRRVSSAGDPWSTIAPVDQRSLIGHIDELLTSLSST